MAAVLSVAATSGLAVLVDLTLWLEHAGICDVEAPTPQDLGTARWWAAAWVLALLAPWAVAVVRSRHRRRTAGFALAAALLPGYLAWDAWSWTESSFRICLFTF